jgi:phosphodiesterase/alkaline phosphatase D-like protein
MFNSHNYSNTLTILKLGLALLMFSSIALAKNNTGQLVEFIWAGATTSSSAVIKARLIDELTVRLAYATSPDFLNIQYAGPVTASLVENNRVVTFNVSGLSENRTYFYAIALGDSLVLSKKGKFKTYPEGPESFSFVFGSCTTTGSNRMIFETIKNLEPLFF